MDTLKETRRHLFFMLFIVAVTIFMGWLSWDADNIFVILLTILVLVVGWYAMKKEHRWMVKRLKELDEE